MNITVNQQPSQTLEILSPSKVEVDYTRGVEGIDVGGYDQQNIFVGPAEPVFSSPGMWIQTGLGEEGQDFTVWFEDGS